MSRGKAPSKTPPWPHDHAAKHAQAARKGWALRRKKFGGGAQHTEKVRHLKERKQPEKKKTPAQLGASHKPAPQAEPRYVISEGRDKRWRIIRLYPDGHTSGLPNTYATRAAAEKEVTKEKGRGGQVVRAGLFDSDVLF